MNKNFGRKRPSFRTNQATLRALLGELNPMLCFKERRAVIRADRVVTVSA